MIEFELIDDTQNIDFELVDDTENIEFNLTDYDDSEIRELINNVDEKADSISSQVETNTTQIAQNKANITALNNRVDQIPIITKTSQITNDSGFIEDNNYVHTDNNYTTTEKNKLSELNNYDDTEIRQDITDLKNNKANRSEIPDVSDFITKNVNNLTYYTLKTNTGSLIDLEVNQSTYVVTLSLKDIDGNVISTDAIDLPLESVVVSGVYDSTNKKIVLTLQSGNTIDIPVGALIAGLQTEITSSNKLASDLIDDTNSGNKFVTTTEKNTWNAKANTSDIPTALSELTEDSTHRTVTDTEKQTWNDKVDYGTDMMKYIRRNSDYIYYPNIDGKPNVSIMVAKGYEQNRNVGLTAENITFTNFENWTYYGIPNYIPLDLSLYNTNTRTNMLQPYTQLPDGDYWVKNPGKIWLGNESYELIGREYIHKKGDVLTIWGGEYACAYYMWNATDEVYEGGFFTTYQDLVDYIADQGFEKGYTITRQTTATGSIVMNDGRWYKRVRETGVTSLTFSLVNSLGEVPDTFKARVTLRTATTFTTFNITQRDAYKLYFVGDDCANGVITGVANKYYNIEFKADGFGDVVGIVHSYELPTT